MPNAAEKPQVATPTLEPASNVFAQAAAALAQVFKQELLEIYRPKGDGAAFLAVSASVANITTLPLLAGVGDDNFLEEER